MVWNRPTGLEPSRVSNRYQYSWPGLRNLPAIRVSRQWSLRARTVFVVRATTLRNPGSRAISTRSL